MPSGPHDPSTIPILTESSGAGGKTLENAAAPAFDFKAAHPAVLAETLELADSLLQGAAGTSKQPVRTRIDRLRTAIPELIDRALREQWPAHRRPALRPRPAVERSVEPCTARPACAR